MLYSGAAERPDREVLRLSDSFAGGESAVEVVCEVVNVNAGRNPEVAGACPVLASYARFVELVRVYNAERGMDLAAAIGAAIDDCVAEGHLASYFEEKRAEVSDMFLTEYNAERQRELDRQEGFDEGVEQGIEQGIEQSVAALRKAGLDEAADLLERGTD